MSQIDNLPRREWNEFLNWYGEAMDFLKEQLDFVLPPTQTSTF